ncbi:exopolyphosphatase [Salibacteraceae bacterium]|nr:exopolyphosphatase [Salibacteraceae bacterium]MDB9709594.1 exopolyphosphatase [Salibacteraceae bacterium]MDC1304195.1 exopolyphosphatase [Salibacteraceae bacterium]HAQ71308.1 exopolyphosphatase [Flavobacteriales bacterium]
MKAYQFAAIDIGSNAVRLLVSNVFEDGAKVTYKKQSLIRVPIRLGADAFLKQHFPEEKVRDFIDTMHAFKHLLNVYRPQKVRALATSAFREADNGVEIVNQVYNETGIKIEIVSGKEEAEVVYANGLRENMDVDKTYLYMDVGGGSTELTLFNNHEAVTSRSFNIGSIRLLLGMVPDRDWDEMKTWVKDIQSTVDKEIAIIGSGGNINKYCKLLMRDYGESVSYDELYNLYKRLRGMSSEDRIQELYLNPDRADVIVPAGKIFTSVMRWSKAKSAYIPKIGVSDGVIKMLYKEHKLENAFL